MSGNSSGLKVSSNHVVNCAETITAFVKTECLQDFFRILMYFLFYNVYISTLYAILSQYGTCYGQVQLKQDYLYKANLLYFSQNVDVIQLHFVFTQVCQN